MSCPDDNISTSSAQNFIFWFAGQPTSSDWVKFKFQGYGPGSRQKISKHVGGLPFVRKALLFTNSIWTKDHVPVTTIIEQNKTAINLKNYYCLTMWVIHLTIWMFQYSHVKAIVHIFLHCKFGEQCKVLLGGLCQIPYALLWNIFSPQSPKISRSRVKNQGRSGFWKHLYFFNLTEKCINF